MLDRILNLPTGVRVALFAVIVIVFLGLGYLTMTPSRIDSTSGPKPTSKDHSTVVPQGPAATAGAPQEAQTFTDPASGVALNLSSPVSQDDLKIAAGRAIAFTNIYLSYRYDQNDAKKVQALNEYMAKENVIEMSSTTPSGPVAQGLVKDKTVVDAKVTEVGVRLISPSMISLTVHSHATTTTVSKGAQQSDDQFSVTLSYDGDRDGWFVYEYVSDATSPYQDNLG